ASAICPVSTHPPSAPPGDREHRRQTRFRRDGATQAPLAVFNTAICAEDSFSVVALTRSPSCLVFDALAIGAVTLGRAINQASAPCVGVAAVALATSSRAVNTFGPFPSRYCAADGPRAELLPRSAVERYLPVRNPPTLRCSFALDAEAAGRRASFVV